ncbi:hypothetical protein IEQ34_010474 [Dendrobium chrysotoxum]|uniref:Uncharacterized protein n=1 Tax=Dendrobium chrysotoxum TaxID=161865 RepID=A0AAV7GSX4_DENCH|nr:hypothetical protein IEQ34_010474 [Dendrobium chrysotoxum]
MVPLKDYEGHHQLSNFPLTSWDGGNQHSSFPPPKGSKTLRLWNDLNHRIGYINRNNRGNEARNHIRCHLRSI